MSELKGLSKAFNTILTRSDEKNAERAVDEIDERKKTELKLRKQLKELRKSRKQIDGHKKVDVLKKDFERQLRRIATRGVVSLFNAVREVKSSADSAPLNQMPIDSFMNLLNTQ